MEEGAQGKEEFTREFGKDYGYPDGPRRIDEIRASEFKRLNGLVYLDHAGASLYSESQMEATFRDLTTNVYGNPHSQSDASMESLCIIQAARQQVLEFINAPAKDYSCIFTSGATAALKLLGEAFPWCTESCFMYTMENHNSVLGIREYALNKGATAVVVDVEQIQEHSGPSNLSFKKLTSIPQRQSGANLSGEAVDRTVYNLFAFPSECNFSGRRFDLELVNVIKEDSSKLLRGSLQCSGCWKVLIDAAKGCATQPPDLTRYPADFVVISFYKIFGYPTGLGALVVKREAAALLEKAYFSGGTVVASISDLDFVKRRKNIEDLFEDGTQSFLGIASLRHGFKLINMLSLPSVERHTSTLNAYVRKALLAMRHENGSVVCVLYGLNDAKGQGPTIAFNLKRPDGTWYGYREVEKLASLSGIQLRTGCFCNPGACAKYLGLSHSELFSNIEAGHVCWDDYDVLHGKPTGAVRISFGYMSTFEDAKKFINFIEKAFVSKASPSTNGSPLEVDVILSSSGIRSMLPRRELYLKTINIFPIKSCSGFSAESWPLSATGLLHDREWCLQSPSGEVLTQKKVPRMSLVGPLIDRTRGLLTVESPYCSEKLQIGLDISCKYLTRQKMNLHAQRYEFQVYNDEINQWFSEAIGCPCTLVRCCSSEVLPCTNGRTASTCRDTDSKLNFVNEAQFLLVTEESVDDLNRRLKPNCERYESDTLLLPIDPIRFRPNLVIGGAEPYEEDDWKAIHIDKEHFSVIGGCNRCQMINRNPKSISMQVSKEPLATLSSYRRVKGKILFGILLRHNRKSYPIEAKSISERNVLMPMLQVGARVYPRTD